MVEHLYPAGVKVKSDSPPRWKQVEASGICFGEVKAEQGLQEGSGM